MTIADTPRKAGPFDGNGAQVTFPFAFKVFTAANLLVVLSDVYGVETTQTLTTHYTVTLNADQDVDPGGDVVMLTAPATGETLTLASQLPIEQPTELTNAGGFYPRVINDALDRITIVQQQEAEKLARSLRMSISSPLTEQDLPTPVPNYLIGWNSSGTGFENYGPVDSNQLSFSTVLFTAVGGETELSTVQPYTSEMLYVDQNGLGLYSGVHFTETTSTTITLATPAVAGDVYRIRVGQYLAASAEIVFRLDALEAQATISVKDFGAVGDGVTDDLAAFTAALSACAGKKLRIPEGAYYLPFTSTSALTPPANINIAGDGRDVAELVFEPSSTTDRNAFSVSNAGFSLTGVTVTLDVPAGGSCSVFAPTASGVMIENCDIDGGCTSVGASISHVAHGIKMPASGTVNDITLRGTSFHRLRYPFLKANTSTCTNRRIDVTDCEFYGNYNEDLSFNSPSGVCDSVVVQGCHFHDGAGIAASVDQLQAAFASVSNFVVSGNTFAGDVLDAIHIEENSINWSVSGNTIDVDGNGIFIIENNVSGSYTTPVNGAIVGNSLYKAGTQKEAGKHGIWIADGAGTATLVALQRSVIANNTVLGFDSGIVCDGTLDDTVSIFGNTAENCNSGIFAPYLNLLVNGNITSNCGIGINASFGGCVQGHTFINCTVAATCGTERPLSLINPAWTFTEFALAAGVHTYKPLCELLANARAYGHLHISEWCEVLADSWTESMEVTWNGTALTATSKVSYEPGAVVVDVVMNSDNLAIDLLCAADRTTVRLEVKLNGMASITDA